MGVPFLLEKSFPSPDPCISFLDALRKGDSNEARRSTSIRFNCWLISAMVYPESSSLSYIGERRSIVSKTVESFHRHAERNRVAYTSRRTE